MYINFINKSDNSFTVKINDEVCSIEPQGFARVFSADVKAAFETTMKPADLLDGFDEKFRPESFKEKIIYKLSKKVLKKLPDAQLNSALTYEITDVKSEEITVSLEEGAYPVCCGNIALFFDMLPIIYGFARCESEECALKVIKAQHSNRKAYLKLVRAFLVFTESGLIFPDLFFFLPKYIFVKILTSNFCTEKILGHLYSYTYNERTNIIFEKTERMNSEDRDKKEGWFIASKIVLGILLVVALFVWANWDEIKLL